MPYAAGIVEQFVEQAERHPDRPAVRTLDDAVTYHELAQRAGGLASTIAETGREGPVLVVATSGIELAIGAFAVLATGLPVVPVDPRSGPEQITAVGRTVGAAAIVTDIGELADAQRSSGLPVVAFSGHGEAPLQPVTTDPDALALVGFTSGSTGPPKTVGETHRSVVRRIGRHEPGDPDAEEVVGMLLGATRSAVRRFLKCLGDGGTLSCFDARSDPLEQILERLAAHEVTYLILIPTYLRRLCNAVPSPPALPSLRLLSAGSEPIDWTDVHQIRTRLSATCVIKHGYGSSETGRVTSYLIDPSEPEQMGTVPVGKPYAGVTVWLASDTGEPVLPGDIGEVVVDSPTIRAGVDAEVLPSGERRYRTGDLGRLLPDGKLMIVGRRDRMVKIGGIRVEPQRVEEVLRSAEGIRDVVVVPEHGHGGQVRIIAHLDAAPDHDDSEHTLRSHAQRHLHEAAVPETFIWHPDGLPTLPNGKVDIVRLAARLPDPERA